MKNLLNPWPWGLLLLAIVAAGCATSGPPRSPIAGSVTVGGQPLPAGRIIFTPVSPNYGPAVTARIVAGKYQVDQADGPVVGQNRVEVRSRAASTEPHPTGLRRRPSVERRDQIGSNQPVRRCRSRGGANSVVLNVVVVPIRV